MTTDFGQKKKLWPKSRDISEILSLSQIASFAAIRRRRTTIMKPKKLRKRIQQLEKCLEEGSAKLAKLKRKLQESETAKALKAARKSAARATASAADKPGTAKKPKKKLNLSPERRAQLSAAMKARWEARRAAEGNSATAPHQNSPTPSMQPPESRGGSV
jgi:hypothetical protein